METDLGRERGELKMTRLEKVISQSENVSRLEKWSPAAYRCVPTLNNATEREGSIVSLFYGSAL